MPRLTTPRKILLACAGIASISLMVLGIYIRGELNNPISTAAPVYFEIKKGDTLGTLALSLQKQNLLPVGVRLFKYYGLLTGNRGAIKAGEYELNDGMDSVQILKLFRSGKVRQRQITFPEGWTFSQWRTSLAGRDDIKQTLTELTSGEIMEKLGEPQLHPEGQFFPDTYHYLKSEADLAILRRAFQRQKSVLLAEWDSRNVGEALRTKKDALILASIVEKESGYGPDRGRVARVFLNRLAKGIRLQSDPTVIYGLGAGFSGNLRRADLKESGPYNTYVNAGLPPTPICMPGLAALKATLQAEPGEDLYFVAKGDGSSHFSVTLEEHNAAVLRYQKRRRRRDYRSSPR